MKLTDSVSLCRYKNTKKLRWFCLASSLLGKRPKYGNTKVYLDLQTIYENFIIQLLKSSFLSTRLSEVYTTRQQIKHLLVGCEDIIPSAII